MPPDHWNALETHLRHCVTRVELLDSSGELLGHGTAFFIAPGLALTCRHVIALALEADRRIRIVTWDRRVLEARVEDAPSEPWPDLALLRVPEGADQPCVVIEREKVARNAQVVLAGFPENTQVSYQAPGAITDGLGYDDHQRPYLKVALGQIEPGMSGGPVVDVARGVVCGITRLSKGKDNVVGGFVLPIGVAIDWSNLVERVYDQPSQGSQEWLLLLGADRLKELGREPDGRRETARVVSDRAELAVEPADDPSDPGRLPRRWIVKIASAPTDCGPVAVGLPELGDDLLDTLDRWSRRRLLTDEEEVKLLGRVLHRALLPTALMNDLQTWLEGANRPLLRLLVSRGQLAEIPWEYATFDDDHALGAHERLAFSRYVAVDAGAPTLPQDKRKALVIVACPPELHQRLPPILHMGRIEQPLDAEELAERLTSTIENESNRRIVVGDVKVNPNVTELRRAITSSDADIVHYVGFGRASGGGELVCVGSHEESVWFEVSSLQELRRNVPPAAAFVLQLLVPPPNEPSIPVPLPGSSLLPLIGRCWNAVVATQHPAPTRHIDEFNGQFYYELGNGSSLESSVQGARRHLRDVLRVDDSTAFGMFSVTTTADADHQLLGQQGHKTVEVANVRGPESPAREALRPRGLSVERSSLSELRGS